MKKLKAIALNIKQLAIRFYEWIIHIPYLAIGYKALLKIGQFFHWILFRLLFPKLLGNATKGDIYRVIFQSKTAAGKRFDVWLLVVILLNLLFLILDSFPAIHEKMGLVFKILEWIFTIAFTLEYYLRIYCLSTPRKYIFSFYGIIDFLAIFPTYLSLFFPATQTLSVLRILRTLRVFRIFRVEAYINEGTRLVQALKGSFSKIAIFMIFVYLTAVVLGSVVYIFEHDTNPSITSIPQGIYWAVVTLTTVGYGDIAPITPIGRFISIVVMILGYSIIAVPTGIVAGEVASNNKNDKKNGKKNDDKNDSENDENLDTSEPTDWDDNNDQKPILETASQTPPPPPSKHCPHCGYEEQDPDALYCRHCGTRLATENKHPWLDEFFRK